ncbi:hypothetical protein NP493_1814g00032 [Ridgeia piscesae]|uniref:Uncharacterized protein n=1 Tax=Ridgeia piscesae TaxID=27915 RepID=A0AAD9JSK2_RIDPI|nr:hypothetical protein NP493_1814g00032 [Ridgeia piscesae]
MAVTTLALILGDSHVCWLERFVSSSGIRFGTGSSFVGTDCHFKFAGFRGGSVSSVRDDGAVDRLLDLQMPAIVVLCLGGNDVYGSPESVLTVVRQSARQKARGRPVQATDPSSVDPARRLATAAATGVAHRRHLANSQVRQDTTASLRKDLDP